MSQPAAAIELTEEALFALIDRIREAVAIDQVEEGQLDDIAKPRPQGRSGIRIDDPARAWRHLRHRLEPDERAHALRLAVHRRAGRPGCDPRRAEDQPPLLVAVRTSVPLNTPPFDDDFRNLQQRLARRETGTGLRRDRLQRREHRRQRQRGKQAQRGRRMHRSRDQRRLHDLDRIPCCVSSWHLSSRIARSSRKLRRSLSSLRN